MPRTLRLATIAALAATLFGVATSTSADTAADLRQRLEDQLQASQLDAALVTARQLSALMPDNQGLWYNLAGLEQSHGDLAAATTAFDRTVALGFDDFRHADDDENLGALRDHPVYREHRARWQDNLTAVASSRAQTLVIGQWSPALPLPDRHGDDAFSASVRLRPGQKALEFEVTVTGHGLTPHAPWRGGSGLFATILLPAADHPAEGTHLVEVGIGQAGGLPVGAVRLGERWQHIAELTPKLIPGTDETTLLIVFSLPWSLTGTLHPLVDVPLGLNLTYLRRGGDLAPARAALLNDPATGRADRTWRRAVPVSGHWPAEQGPAVRLRPDDLVVRDGVLALDPMALVVPGVQPATVDLVLRDHTSEIQKRATFTVDGPAGRRTRTETLSLQDVATGSARLGISYLDPATDDVAAWDTELVVLPRAWETRTAARIDAAPTSEQPSLRYRLDAITGALKQRHPRDLPGAVGTTVDELEAMLTRLDANGTTLEAGISYLAIMPAGQDHPELRCSLYLPESWRRDRPLRTLVLLSVAMGGEQRVVNLVPRFLAERGADLEPVLVAFPHLGELLPAAADTALVGHLLDWLDELVTTGPLYLAGTDLQAATVLELAAARRPHLAGILMLTGLNFVPYPGETAAELADRVAGIDPALPAGWFWFPDEQGSADQARPLRRALRAAGLELNPALAVPGGLDLNQAWTRALLWALQQE